MNLQQAFAAATVNILNQVVLFLPRLVAALVVFLIGLVIASWGKRLTVKLLKTIRLSQLIRGSGMATFLEKAEVSTKIEEVLGGVVRWVLILVFLMTTVNVLGLTAVSEMLNVILGFIPKLVSAALILGIGVLVAGLLESVVKGALGSLDLKAARLVGKLTSYVTVVFAALAAMAELGIAAQFVNALVFGTVGMMALGLGLALGLGSKDLVADLLKEWYKELKQRN